MRLLPGGCCVMLFVAAAIVDVPPIGAQQYRVSLDARAQSVAFRGWTLDSVPLAQVAPGPSGGPTTPDGFSADCPAGGSYCYFFRPGPRQNTASISETIDAALWGLGVEGLSAHANARILISAGDVDWAGTDPALQLWEGYLKYVRPSLELRAGRQLVSSRLGLTGFDGGRVALRSRKLGLDAGVFLGWGLARATSVSITSDAVNPLADFRPGRRTFLWGALTSWSSARADVRLDWQREVEREAQKLASDRLALSGAYRFAPWLTLLAGGEYDIAQGWLGTADASLRYTGAAVTASGGYRRYRPHFDLWSVWPAFSPVPYNGAVGSASVRLLQGLELRGRAEYYQFEDAEVTTALVDVESDGWRWNVGATLSRLPRWTFTAGYAIDHGVGARGEGWDASVGWRPSRAITLQAYAAALDRPLEYRFEDAKVRSVGLTADWRAGDALSFGVGGTYIYENRRRDDAAAFNWNQTRFTASVSYILGSHVADRRGLPEAVLRMPSLAGNGR